MPISLPPLNRRNFLRGTLAAGAGLFLGRDAFSAEAEIDPHRFFLLSDTHIAADKTKAEKNTVMYNNLKQACTELLAEERRAAAVIVNGDCAYHTGEPADYANFLELIKPVREKGMPIHLAMGNHDRRENFWNAIPEQDAARKAVDGRQINVIDSPRATWIMLDSLDKTDVTPGVLGEKQLTWLKETLDAKTTKPVIVMVHHDPHDPARPKVSGITDTKEFLDIIVPRKQVKALIYGHTHVWNIKEREGMHCINLPTVAYVFKAGSANGWVDFKLAESGAELQLHCIDPKHEHHLQKVSLTWR